MFFLSGAFVASEPRDPDSSEGPVSSVSSCQRTPIYKPFTQCKLPVDCPPHPAPHSITDEELHFVKTCLQRWRTEVENDINGTLIQLQSCIHATATEKTLLPQNGVSLETHILTDTS